MTEQPTCGRGLAQNSSLPEKLGELTAAVAEILEVHTEALDLSDDNSKAEHAAYVDLARRHRSIAIQLGETARQMASSR